MSIQPQGDDLRKAVKWVSEERKFEPEKSLKKIVEQATIKFDLSPKDAEFLCRFVMEENK